ncbi:alpha/beta fold hydrolase [Kitasatospora sp. NPDC051914]|uniref:alpha/beta hydrolase family protein n=1 Tax=Kitasatospora sp. NPDC051914 TaxID=3154945 RepID=UPI00341CE4FA
MSTFLELPGILHDFTLVNRSRAIAAGLDAFAYDRVTAGLGSLIDWSAAFRAVGRAHVEAAGAADARGHRVSAGESYRSAARWFHCASWLPHPDRALAARAAAEADAAMADALARLDPGAVRIEGETFTGWLRRPAGTGGPAPATVLVIPGMDSGKEEFHGVVEALLARGLAALALDGPGQGVRAATGAPRPDYQAVVGEALDALTGLGGLDPARTALIGLSLGGYYAAVAAAHEPRVRAAATVSGPYRLVWDELPPFVTDTLTQRAGGRAAAREFADRVDLTAAAGLIGCPLRVVDGGMDTIPGVVNGEPLARSAPRGEYLLVPHGDHLLGNARPDWLPGTADWLADRLRG